MTITNLKAGLGILKTYNASAPVVAQPYMIMVPAVKDPDLSGIDRSALTTAGWVLHPIYNCYYYPAETITELEE